MEGRARRIAFVSAALVGWLAAGAGGAAGAPADAAGSPPPLQGEAGSAAAGDIPDNQVFLLFHDSAAGYSLKVPEGWAQQGGGRRVVFRDKNNIVRVLVQRGPAARLHRCGATWRPSAESRWRSRRGGSSWGACRR